MLMGNLALSMDAMAHKGTEPRAARPVSQFNIRGIERSGGSCKALRTKRSTHGNFREPPMHYVAICLDKPKSLGDPNRKPRRPSGLPRRQRRQGEAWRAFSRRHRPALRIDADPRLRRRSRRPRLCWRRTPTPRRSFRLRGASRLPARCRGFAGMSAKRPIGWSRASRTPGPGTRWSPPARREPAGPACATISPSSR